MVQTDGLVDGLGSRRCRALVGLVVLLACAPVLATLGRHRAGTVADCGAPTCRCSLAGLGGRFTLAEAADALPAAGQAATAFLFTPPYAEVPPGPAARASVTAPERRP